MNYSRRQLYALGEPLGEGVTRLKPGGRIYGGGDAPSTPANTTNVQTMELPEWARGYAKDTLAKASALTDINKNPYQQYGGQRIAGFQPLQEQAFKTVGGMDAGPTGFKAGIGEYMSPYMQNVVDVEKREAARQAGIAGTQQQAQATQAGAFGGGRDAIMRAERERNLSQQMGDIQARGSQAAYEQAANQFRQGIQQQSGLAQLQGQMGAQQQQQAQRPLDVAYQDFLNQQNYPYKQLGFMSDMVRGLPLGQQSTSQIYQGSGPGMIQTLAGLGGAAYGFGKSGLFGAEGGLMKSYADGGMAMGELVDESEPVIRYEEGGVTSDQNVENILSKLSDQQLVQAKEAALNRRDIQQAQMIDAEMAERASIRGGLGGAFNQIPVEQQEAMMAGGGIVAFAPGGATYLDKAEEARQQQLDYIRQATAQQAPEEFKTNVLSQRDVVKNLYEPSVVPKYLEEIKAERAALPEKMESEKGLAFAMASLKLLNPSKNVRGRSQGEQLISGLGEAGEAFAGEVNRLKKEHKEADRLLRQSEMQLAMADQLYNNGLTDKAVARADKAQELKSKAAEMYAGVAGDTSKMYAQLEGTKLGADASRYAAELGYKGHLASAAATMNKPSAQKEGAMAIFNDPSFAPGKPPEERYRLATERYLEMTKTGIPGVNARIEATAREKAAKDFNDAIAPGGSARKEYNELKKKGTPEQLQAFEDRLFNKFLIMHSGEATPAPGATQQAPAAQQQQQAVPPLNVWMDAARKANPGVSDADLAKYYNSKYGK
jgi:hypothetical protein